MNTHERERILEAAVLAAGKPCRFCTKPAEYVVDTDGGIVALCNQHYQEMWEQLERETDELAGEL